MKHLNCIASLGSLAAGLILYSCALLSKAEPIVPRYFTPENIESRAAQAIPKVDARRLRLGTVDSGSQLRERIMYRSASHELGYYEDRRWTERPDAYLRRGLVRVLFEERGLFQVTSGSAPTLDAELVAFEVLPSSQPRVRVQVVIALDDALTGKLSRTITVEQAVGSRATADAAEAEINALSGALQSCLTQVAELVVSRLEAATAEKTPRP
jgi:cholesterol transport system auxiliary component